MGHNTRQSRRRRQHSRAQTAAFLFACVVVALLPSVDSAAAAFLSHHPDRRTSSRQQQKPWVSCPVTVPSAPPTSFFKRTTSSSPDTTTIRVVGSARPQDLEITFGSDDVGQGGGPSFGEDENDMEVRKQRQDTVQQMLKDADDGEWKERRRDKNWGRYAQVKNVTQLQHELEIERKEIGFDFDKKAKLASAVGVSLEVLEPKEDENYLGTVFEDNGKIQISSGSGGGPSWFSDIDDELREEWKALTEEDNSDAEPTNGENENDDDSEDNKSSSALKVGDDFVQDETSGKLVARERLSGVRVGSAGGWTLEVFPGDFVVHRKFGIGKFERTCLRSKTRLSKSEKDAQSTRRAEILTVKLRERQAETGRGVTPDEIQEIRSSFGTESDKDPISNPQSPVLEITYADAVVHVPVDRAYRLSRYRAGDALVKPKLSRVRGEAWSKARQRVEANTLELAQDVLALYATRETLKRPPFDPAMEDMVQEFSQSFPFEPTPDQVRCFEDVENDMVWRGRPMDRLVCGDVGFGKTEVAIRAMYRCIANGKQAAFLSPTGVLAAQHFKTVVKRMGHDTPYNVTVGMLRGGMGKNTKSGQELREAISNGDIQLVVGTHALLSKDLSFKDLGLLVVDEEQRFGVKQKERLKLICSGIDVLTLSATPIPRTLQMSLSGIRDTSTIRSPPPMRKPTVTYVQDFSESMVRQAIQAELERGGQCYYVVPRISMLDDAGALITRLFPDIRIIQAHGRMHRNGAEENVAEFAEGHYDILLATTVIENGVDIPTVNTIVVQNSQAFGMSTLYQLRGRVGRSDKQAFAYFLHREESITEQAVQRLQAIGELNELGSGFDVANRDLEIRGAGSLLGTEQSGMAARVGFDLYMRMLKKSIRQLRGLDLPVVPRTNILLPTPGSPSTFRIPKSYIKNEKERREEESKARLAENTANLVALTNEWKDQYGPLPASLQKKLKTMHLHACTRRLGVDLVGLVDESSGDDVENQRMDCVLRSPGLRPRHWATILNELPRKVAPKGLDVIFPPRFTLTGEEVEVAGGKKSDLRALLADGSLSEEREEEEWDAMDQEEIEAMKDISSAVNVKRLDEVDIEQYPRLVMKNFGSPDDSKFVDVLLKVLLPVSKIVYQKQSEQAEDAKSAAALREKQEEMRKRKKANEALESQRLGYMPKY